MFSKVKRRLASSKSQAGFTLIELLVVITILGILAAIVVFSVGGIGDKGQDSACKTDLTTIQTAQEAYSAVPTLGNGKYAPDAPALKTANLLSTLPTLHTTTGLPAGGPYTSYKIDSVAGQGCTNSLP